MAENCSVLDPWAVQYAYTAGVTGAAAFARQNDALARALRISLISERAAVPSPESSSSLLFSPAGDPFLRRNSAAGRVAKKRKSRASKRSPTTYITADQANFRELVQRVTGTGSPDPAELPLLQPPEEEVAAAQGTRRLLPTLDTSAFLPDGGAGFVGATVDGPPVMTDFDPFFLVPNYPTIDWWGAM